MSTIKSTIWKSVLLTQGRTLQYLKRLTRWQWLEKQKNVDLQNDRLVSLLLHAYRNVPYYGKVLQDAGVIDGAGRANLGAFSRIPLLNKDIIRSHSADLRAAGSQSRHTYTNTSGGSTGEPVILIQDSEFRDWVRAASVLFGIWTGYHPGQKMVKLWGSERDLFVGRETLRTNAIRWVRNEYWLNAFRMTTSQMFDYVHQINVIKPVHILAYVESLYSIARFINEKGLPIVSPVSIMTSAGRLDSHVRTEIQKVFGAPVFDRYGSREVGDIASECELHRGLHICTPLHYVEILGSSGEPVPPGNRGQIVITSLVNYSMPLIRYCIGDLGILSEQDCACGRGWPTLTEVTGRITDVFHKQDGTQIHGEYFTHLFYLRPWLQKFQIVQEDYAKIVIYVVPKVPGDVEELGKTYSNEVENIVSKVRLAMGEDCVVCFRFVTDIPPLPSGKFQYTISQIVT